MSAFGSEFVAMKIAIEMNDALVYKLCMCSLMVLQMCLVTMQVINYDVVERAQTHVLGYIIVEKCLHSFEPFIYSVLV